MTTYAVLHFVSSSHDVSPPRRHLQLAQARREPVHLLERPERGAVQLAVRRVPLAALGRLHQAVAAQVEFESEFWKPGNRISGSRVGTGHFQALWVNWIQLVQTVPPATGARRAAAPRCRAWPRPTPPPPPPARRPHPQRQQRQRQQRQQQQQKRGRWRWQYQWC
jgi:hypothetical protein